MLNNVVTAALRNTGYYLDIMNNTFYMTSAFKKKSDVYGTDEYTLVNRIMAEYPDVDMIVNKPKGKNTITYEMMEKFIKIMPDADVRMTEYKNVKLKSRAFRSSYKYVVEWFNKRDLCYNTSISYCKMAMKERELPWKNPKVVFVEQRKSKG